MHIAFDGLCFHGTQKQNGLKTVQGELEKILSSIYDTHIDLECCSRLDGDVSAMDFVCAYKPIDDRIEMNKIPSVLSGPFNGILKVKSIVEIDDSFSPRYNSHSKTYLYTFDLDGEPVFQSHSYNPPKNFDLEVYKEALKIFLGEHDFEFFSSKDDRKNEDEKFGGCITEIRVQQRDNFIYTFISGPYFNRYQIRFMIGAAVNVACQLESFESVKERLNGLGDNSKPRFKVPGKALTLYKVSY